jgi:hypothetical protein
VNLGLVEVVFILSAILLETSHDGFEVSVCQVTSYILNFRRAFDTVNRASVIVKNLKTDMRSFLKAVAKEIEHAMQMQNL